MAPRIETVVVEASPTEVFLFEPATPDPHAAMILAMHIPIGHTGIENDEFTLRTAERYAEAGFVVAVPFIFHWRSKSADIDLKRREFRDDRTALDLRAAYDLLPKRPTSTTAKRRWTPPARRTA